MISRRRAASSMNWIATNVPIGTIHAAGNSWKHSFQFTRAARLQFIACSPLRITRIFGAFLFYLFENNEICLWQNKSTAGGWSRFAMKSDFVGLCGASYHPRLVLGLHLSETKISSAFADFITAGDLIPFCGCHGRMRLDFSNRTGLVARGILAQKLFGHKTGDKTMLFAVFQKVYLYGLDLSTIVCSEDINSALESLKLYTARCPNSSVAVIVMDW